MRTRPTIAFHTLILSALVAAAVSAPVAVEAQHTALSPVPKEPCCFNNFRFAGTCRVTPRQGQLCQNVLSYLNNLNSSGESYCSSTFIRGGWTLVDCASGAASGPIGHMEPQRIKAVEPHQAPATGTSRAGAVEPGGVSPRAVEPLTVQATDANVIQVRLERPVGDAGLSAGQELTGRLEADVYGPDGELLAPAGSTISATIGAAQAWQQEADGRGRLHLVGTATTAADLFGTAEQTAAGETAGAAVQLTGEVVELSDDQILTFSLEGLSEQPADMRVLDVATTVWMEAFNDHDAITIAGLSSEDGALLPPHGRAIIGRAAIYDYWKTLLADSTTTVELVNVETVVEGDMGYKAGRFELVDAESGAPVDRGKYMQIWKRTPQGYWELHRDMWNSSLSAD